MRAILLVLGLIGLSVSCGRESVLPIYSLDQTDSTHPGYRRTTITGRGEVYVNDYEEYALQLVNVEPTKFVGLGPMGHPDIAAIDGQSTAAYLAVDVGSEMPAYAVFRNVKQPVFDWRKAQFQSMRLNMLLGPAANKLTSDSAIIADVVATLRDGEPATLPPIATPSGMHSNVATLALVTAELPGLVFCPAVYFDPAGPVYLAESYAVQYHRTNETILARWIPASVAFTRWSQTR